LEHGLRARNLAEKKIALTEVPVEDAKGGRVLLAVFVSVTKSCKEMTKAIWLQFA